MRNGVKRKRTSDRSGVRCEWRAARSPEQRSSARVAPAADTAFKDVECLNRANSASGSSSYYRIAYLRFLYAIVPAWGGALPKV